MASTTMRIDITNQRFGRLVTIKRIIPEGETKNKWFCRCDCGNECLVRTSDLRNGRTQSCGCLKRELDFQRNRTHGLSHTRLHKIWRHMKDRCLNPNSKSYKDYGGRGIVICEEWKNNFENFMEWALASGYKSNLTIERIDVNGNYEPNNCCWIPLIEQAKNRRTTHYLTFNNETHNIREWSKIIGISENAIHHRLKSGWSIEKTLTTPSRKDLKVEKEK